jgi:hypothetical protein
MWRKILQSILSKDTVTAVIPGVSTVYEAENAVLASYTRPLPVTAADKVWMESQTERHRADLSPMPLFSLSSFPVLSRLTA